MGYLALACAAAGLLGVVLPGAGKYLAIGLGTFAIGAGVVGYRRGTAQARLSSAAGVALGVVALALGATKVGLTIMALERLERLFSP
jgi:hypothetical protein